MSKGKYHEWLTDDGLNLIRGWARKGLTHEQIAKNMGITAKTLYEWKNKYSEFSNALKKSKDMYDNEVEDALNDLATGKATTSRRTVKRVRDPVSGEMVTVEETVTTERIPPNVAALIFWLKNRRPDDWRENPESQRQKEEAESAGNVVNIICDFPRPEMQRVNQDEEIEKARAELEEVEGK